MFCHYGLGHTLSRFFAGQNSRILSNRYCFRSAESPMGIIIGGRSSADGDHIVFFTKLFFLSGPELSTFTNTAPGELVVNLKWCILIIPFNAVLMVCSSKCSLQLYMDTKVVPSSDLTNCGTFTEEERETQLAMSSFGKKTVVNRSFQSVWFNKYPWLHYIENDDAVLCITCAQASAQKKLQWSSSSDLAFISKGFTNWKDATVKFSIHEASKCHKESVLKMVTLPSTTQNVAECWSNSPKKEKYGAMAMLFKSVV